MSNIFGRLRRQIAMRLAMLIALTMLLSLACAPLYNGIGPSIAQLTAYALEPPDTVSASAALLVEGATGRVLYEQNAHDKLFPASTTKILTVMLVLEAVERGELSLTDEVEASSAMVNSVIWDASHVSPRIKIGEKLTVEEYIYCIMLDSDCASCNILAERVCGTVDAFVQLMNRRAEELGCESTHFANTHGYPDDNHYTTAWSLYLIAAQAMKNDFFREVVCENYHKVPASNLAHEREIYNTNMLLHNVSSTDYYYQPCIGIKTGTTESSGYCLVAAAEQNGMTLYSVVLGAQKIEHEDGTVDRQSFSESKRLFEWGYESYSYRSVLSTGTAVATIPVEDSGGVLAQLVPAEGAMSLLACDAQPKTEVSLNAESLTAPVPAGLAVGEVRITLDGELLASATLVVAEPIEERKGLLGLVSGLAGGSKPASIIIMTNLGLLLIFAAAFIVKTARRRSTAQQSQPNYYRRSEHRNYTGHYESTRSDPFSEPYGYQHKQRHY